MNRLLRGFTPRALLNRIAAGVMLGLFGAAVLAQTPPTKVRPFPRPGSAPPPVVAQPHADPKAPPQPPAQAVPAGPKPVVQVVGDERFDFGSFWPDSTQALQHSFTLKNAGDAELQIIRVQPG